MDKRIDCRGLECPKPVVNTKQALDEIESGIVTVIVDNKTSLENIKRLARKSGHRVSVEDREGNFYINITKKGKAVQATVKQSQSTSDRYAIFITTDRLGTGDERLGEILIKAFLNTIWEADKVPDSIVLINNGVKLSTEGSEVLDTLELLGKKGIHIVSCGTCLAYYKLTDKLKVGQVSNMYEIVNILLDAPKILKI